MDYDSYMQGLFDWRERLDLRSESKIFGEDASSVALREGGKKLGLLVLERLIDEFGDPSLRLVPDVVMNSADTIINPFSEKELADFGTTYSIIRSNASWEYGAPPGLLQSKHGVKVGEEVKMEQMVSSFRDVPYSQGRFYVLVQPQLFPQASGIMYTSFVGNCDDPTIIEATLGSPVSATIGFPNLIHYRIKEKEIKMYPNFGEDVPPILLIGKVAYMDVENWDLSHREREVLLSVSQNFEGLTHSAMAKLWNNNTYDLGERSPLQKTQIDLLHTFGKFAEQKLEKQLKVEFSIQQDKIYLLQLDPLYTEINDQDLTLKGEGLILETPFVNKPTSETGIKVVVEALGRWGNVPADPFVYVSMQVPLNVNIRHELLRPYPQCRGIINASGSRLNHCYSDARTMVPVLGFPKLYDSWCSYTRMDFGYNENLRMDLGSDGRWGRMRLYKQ